MKNILLITVLLIATVAAQSQTSVPQGMRYQAMARDANGIIKANEKLIAKVELVTFGATESVVYSELHNVTSSEFGLLNMTIGEGINTLGSFSEVPWSEHNLWVRVSIRGDNSNDYHTITTSRFYTVPYAFYAESAGRLAQKDATRTQRSAGEGQNSINWTLEGNRDAQNRNDGNPVLGTVDNNALVVVTNNLPRLLIAVDGHSNFTGDLDVDGVFNADQNVTLNTMGGSTTIYGPTTVDNMSPTHLTGTLQVDKASTLNDALTVENMASTHLTGDLDVDKTLNVDGATTLNGSLDVTNMSPTHLTGTLTVDKGMAVGDAFTVENMAPSHLTGSLDVDKTLNVDGATTLNSSLDVTGMSPTHLTGTLTVDKATTLNDALSVQNMAATHLTGSLDVDKTLNVDGATTLNGSLDVTGMSATHLTGTLVVDKLTTLSGGISLSGNGTLGPNGDHLAFFNNTEGGNSDGIGIQIQNNKTTAENNFVTFYRGDDGVAGRIEGYVLNDIGLPPIPTGDEIWTALCIAIADYNPVTLFWTQFALQFNLFGTIWNGATIPSFDPPDFPGLTLPDFPGLGLPDFPGLTLPDFPGLVLPNFPGVTIPDVPSVSIPDVGQVFGGLTLPDIPSLNIPDIPGFVVPDIPGFVVPDIPAFAIPDIPPFEIPEVPEINLSDDLFEIPVIPTFSDILMDLGVCPDEDIFELPSGSDPGGYVARLVDWGLQNDMQNMITFDPVDLVAKALIWGVQKVVMVDGVSYGARGADYAEYLPKLNEEDHFVSGELVGVHGGRISKSTEGADQILAISTNPVVLGNLPDEKKIADYEKVGFLGQVPVFVQGPVEVGDYIIPSGKNDGIGMAVGADELTASILPKILGKAWSAAPLHAIAVINVSIGLRPTEIAEVLKQREANMYNLQQQIEEQNRVHDHLKSEVELLKKHLGLENYSSVKGSK